MKILKNAKYEDMEPWFEEALKGPVDAFFQQMAKKPFTIVHARSGKHSKNSLHYKGRAVDVRIWAFKGDYPQIYYVCSFLCNVINTILKASGGAKERFLIVLHETHIHMQMSQGSHNIKGYKAGKYVYPDAAVRAILNKHKVRF